MKPSTKAAAAPARKPDVDRSASQETVRLVLARLDEAARAACRPISDKRGTAEFRTKITGVLARRVATIAYARAKERT